MTSTSSTSIRRTAVAVLASLAGLFVAVSTVSAQEANAEESSPKKAQKHTLKIASLAPKGSSWMNAFENAKRIISRKTDAKIRLKLYPGGVMGDESAMVRKMRTGQLDGAAVTNVGLGEIDKKLLVLQLPLTFRNAKELDYVRDKMSGTFKEILSNEGFDLLTWGDVGFNYLFSQSAVHKPADIRKTTPWVWNTDPISKTVMNVMDINAVELGVPDVLPSLQTGVVDAFLNSPYGAVALQWYTKAKYVTNLRLAVVIGGVIISESSMKQLSAKQQKIVRQTFADEGKTLLAQIRKDNKQAIKTIGKAGIKSVKPTNMKQWKKMAQKARQKLTGTIFPKALVAEMMKHLEAVR